MKPIRIQTESGIKVVIPEDIWDTINDGTVKSYALYGGRIYCVVHRDFDGAIFAQAGFRQKDISTKKTFYKQT